MIREGDEFRKNIEEKFNILSQHKIPDTWTDVFEKGARGTICMDHTITFKTLIYREKYIATYGFCLVAQDWINELARTIGSGRCMEIMSGLGLITFALQEAGVNCFATDDFSYKNHPFWFGGDPWIKTERIDAVEAIKKYGAECDYIICSVPYDNMAYLSLMAMREVNPECKMIYIGEGIGGYTADDDFFKSLNTVDDLNDINILFRTFPVTYDFVCMIN